MTKHIALYLILFLFSSCKGQESKYSHQKINGLSFVASNRKLVQKDTESVNLVNANWVALMPFGFMKNTKDPSLSFNHKRQWWGETAEGIKVTSALFEKQKVKRMLKPQIWIRGGKFTGLISMETEEQWLELEKNYTSFILFYAQLAQKANVELFCIGTELNLFVTNRPKYWSNLIVQIKQIYSGKITYASNWDSYNSPTFWKELDYIGIDAYFPLSNSKTPTLDELTESWLPIKETLKKFSEQNNKSIIFTEFGYRSIDYPAKEPWDSSIKESYNAIAQQNSLQALFHNCWQEPWMEGGFLWKWFDNQKEAGGVNNKGFTVQNKLAEDLVGQFYKNQIFTNE